jgi:hypothetical protein
MSQEMFPNVPALPKLHVFEQDDRWHWGITKTREKGGGFKVVAYSNTEFLTGDAAYAAGREVLTSLTCSG